MSGAEQWSVFARGRYYGAWDTAAEAEAYLADYLPSALPTHCRGSLHGAAVVRTPHRALTQQPYGFTAIDFWVKDYNGIELFGVTDAGWSPPEEPQ